jgi:ribosomal-protein-alanine N-acetyltransferase
MTLKPKKNITHKFINQKSGRDHYVNTGALSMFLQQHLDEYGDKIEDIQKAIDYIFDKEGGFVLVQFLEKEITGVIVVNETGMGGYIPENILVYIAVNKKYRGNGYGQDLMKNAIKLCKGDVALHVEKDNPAVFLYEKMGFTNPYIEMRLKR